MLFFHLFFTSIILDTVDDDGKSGLIIMGTRSLTDVRTVWSLISSGGGSVCACASAQEFNSERT
jgi:hypothetical protein